MSSHPRGCKTREQAQQMYLRAARLIDGGDCEQAAAHGGCGAGADRSVGGRGDSSLDGRANVDRAGESAAREHGTVVAMKDYYEDLWERLPQDTAPPDQELRERFLLGEVRRGDRALDLGSGDGHFTRVLSRAGAQVVGARRRPGRGATCSYALSRA